MATTIQNELMQLSAFHALIVEDDTDFSMIVERCLTLAAEPNIKVRKVQTLKSALEQLAQSPAEVVLLDLNLPDSLGLDTVRAINSASPEAAIIVLTATGGDEIARLMLRGGAQDFMTKDEMDARSLRRAISYALERKRADKELRSSRNQVRTLRMSHDAILRATPAALASLRNDWTVEWANDAMQQLFRAVGRPGTSLRDLFPTDTSFAEYKASARKHTAESLPDRRELLLPLPDGMTCICELSLVRLNPEETRAGYLATIVDITDRAVAKEQREALIRLAQRLNNISTEEELGNTAAEECERVFRHEAFWFSRYDYKANALRHVYMEDTAHGSSVAVPIPVSGKPESLPYQPSFATGKPRLVNRGIDSDNQTAEQMQRFGNMQRKAMSLMFAPMVWQGEVLGVLSVQSYRSHRYSEPDLELLCGFADQCGIALARLRAREDLLKSESLYRGIVEDQTEAIVRFQPDYTLSFCNRSFLRAIGENVQAATNTCFLNYVPAADHKRIKLLLGLIKPANPTIDVEHSLVGTRSETLKLLWTYRGIFDETGSVLQFQAVGTDVTRLRIAESALARSEQRLELIVGQIPALLYTTDENLNLTSALGRFAGLGPDLLKEGELIGKPIAEVLSGENQQWNTLQEAHELALQSASPGTYVFSCESRYYHASVQPLRRSDNEIIGLVGIVIDVTEQRDAAEEQRRLQDELHANEKLAMIGRAMASIGHCMKNMITGLNGGMFLVDRCCDAADSVNPMLLQAQDLLRRSTARISLLLLNMLDVSKERQPNIAEANLEDLLEEVAAVLRMSSMGDGVDVQVHVEDQLHSFFVDSDRLYRSTLNLGLNALDAIGGSGRLVLSAKLAEPEQVVRLFQRVDEESKTANSPVNQRAITRLVQPPTEAMLRLDVTDTGMGMDAHVLEQLFEPFFSTKFSRGTGLGLASTLQFVQSHGGQIVVRSAVNAGTTFTLFLPQQPARVCTEEESRMPAEVEPAIS